MQRKMTGWMMGMAAAAMSLGVPAAHAAGASPVMMTKMQHRYFVHHSFGFPRIFYRFHPGPHWDVMNAAALHLTAAQISQEKKLVIGIMQGTKQDIMALQKAYRQYRVEARLPSPSIRALEQDVHAVGRAQADLASVMIPYHIKGYRLLNAAQQELYHHLAAQNWSHMVAMMRHQISPMPHPG